MCHDDLFHVSLFLWHPFREGWHVTNRKQNDTNGNDFCQCPHAGRFGKHTKRRPELRAPLRNIMFISSAEMSSGATSCLVGIVGEQLHIGVDGLLYFRDEDVLVGSMRVGRVART